MKCLVPAGLLLGAVCLAIAAPASAQEQQRKCPHGGFCRPGTCAEWDHGSWACDVRNCKAENCRPR
jgi:hypothetical protein